MTDDTSAVDSFETDLRALISRYAAARLLTMAETVGVLHVVATDIIHPREDEDEE
jgi:hypothetical protein